MITKTRDFNPSVIRRIHNGLTLFSGYFVTIDPKLYFIHPYS
ncbi:hypothetical protein PITCH_A520043 [uncultured Desulfobacterium sp.]|uniref:Uncharacterized protein n=1 Tax=uncultured Desulfobacterium sp. TaxID=201089 RepID=A0A445N0Q1_9BACT|nr:hypothetical protein PITCH_A520043 [uncultured Desulfobacterium sp.]